MAHVGIAPRVIVFPIALVARVGKELFSLGPEGLLKLVDLLLAVVCIVLRVAQNPIRSDVLLPFSDNRHAIDSSSRHRRLHDSTAGCGFGDSV